MSRDVNRTEAYPREPPQTVPPFVCARCLSRFDRKLEPCPNCGGKVESVKIRLSPVQVTLVDFAGFMSETRQNFADIKDALRRSQGTAAMYQAQHGHLLEENQELNETISKMRFAIAQWKSEAKSQVEKEQNQLYAREQRRSEGFEVLEKFLELWPSWDPIKTPYGIDYKNVAKEIPRLRDSSVRRRLNELAKPHENGCKGYCSQCIYGFDGPPLEWKIHARSSHYKIRLRKAAQ